MENKKKPTKKTVKKGEPIKSMFTPEELKEKAFDSKENMEMSFEIVKEIYAEGGVIMMRSNKDTKGKGNKVQIFCKNVSSKEIYALAVQAIIPERKKLKGQDLRDHLEKSKQAYAAMVDMYLAAQDGIGIGMIEVKSLKKLKSLMKKLKEALEDEDDDDDDDEDDD